MRVMVLVSASAKRVLIAEALRTVGDGPFTDALVAGYWIVEVPSIDDAVEWGQHAM